MVYSTPSFRGPRSGAGFRVSGSLRVTYFAYLDEFGHIGPYLGRHHPRHNDSPVFGFAGLVLPVNEVRGFGTWFFQRKCHLLDFELERSGEHPALWENKGSSLYTVTNVERYRELRTFTNRMLNKIEAVGGFGASARADGCSGVDGPLGNCSNVPVESLDMDFDFFRVREYSLIPDSGGGGAFRGGLGIRRRYEILADEVQYAQYGDRFRFQPDGLFGGEPGAAASCHIERDGEITELPCKESAWLRSGDVLTVSTGGGGGYGAPDGRSAERIDDDAGQRRTSARRGSSFERPDAEIAK